MKKFLAIIFVMLVWLPLTAFSNVSSGAIIYATTVQEVVTFSYDETDAIKLNKSEEFLSQKLAIIGLSTKEYIESVILDNVTADNTLSLSEKQKILEDIIVEAKVSNLAEEKKFYITITYKDKNTWNYMCSKAIDMGENITEKSFFTTTYKTIMPIKISSYNVLDNEVSLIDLVTNKIKFEIKNQFIVESSVVDIMFSSDISYSYVSTLKRLHSNADYVEVDSNNFYYHTWNFENDDDLTITVWQTVANPVVWYCLAIVLTGVFAGVLLIIAKYKKLNTKKTKDN